MKLESPFKIACIVGVINKLPQREESFFRELQLPMIPHVGQVLKISKQIFILENVIFDVDQQQFTLMVHPTEIDDVLGQEMEKTGWTRVANK